MHGTSFPFHFFFKISKCCYAGDNYCESVMSWHKGYYHFEKEEKN